VTNTLDYERLLKLRLIVARYGEMDIARWWNTNGVLGRYGSIAVSRGFPNTHPFVRARIVFTAARERCREMFAHPDCITLWQLPTAMEDQFDSLWQDWLDLTPSWQSFFQHLEALQGNKLTDILTEQGLVSSDQIRQIHTLQISSTGWTVTLPGTHQADDDTVTMLAAAFARGDVGKPVVPYARLEETA